MTNSSFKTYDHQGVKLKSIHMNTYTLQGKIFKTAYFTFLSFQ